MSDPKNKRGFNATPWESMGQNGPKSKDQGAGKAGDEFRALYSGGKNAPKQAFVASFVSREKAMVLARSQQGDSRADQPSRESLEEMEQRAYETGFAEGEKEGMEEGRRKSKDAVDRIQGILTDMESAWRSLIRTHETQMIQLVYRVAEKVVYGQAAIDQEMVKRAIIEAFKVVPEPVNVQITVNPKDYEYIETVKEDFFARIKALKDVSVSPDPAIHPGGCTIRTKYGEVDATLESRLEAVRESLIKANGRKPF